MAWHTGSCWSTQDFAEWAFASGHELDLSKGMNRGGTMFDGCKEKAQASWLSRFQSVSY